MCIIFRANNKLTLGDVALANNGNSPGTLIEIKIGKYLNSILNFTSL